MGLLVVVMGEVRELHALLVVGEMRGLGIGVRLCKDEKKKKIYKNP